MKAKDIINAENKIRKILNKCYGNKKDHKEAIDIIAPMIVIKKCMYCECDIKKNEEIVLCKKCTE